MKRVAYFILTLIFLWIEVVIALYVRDDFIRPYVGDMLVVVVIYTFIRIFIPEKVRLLPLFVFLFAASVEVLQYYRIVEVLGVDDIPFLAVLIGTSFDVKDIVCYGIGCAILGVYEIFLDVIHLYYRDK